MNAKKIKMSINSIFTHAYKTKENALKIRVLDRQRRLLASENGSHSNFTSIWKTFGLNGLIARKQTVFFVITDSY